MKKRGYHSVTRRLAACVGALATGAVLLAAATPSPVDPLKALQDGNRLFRDGRIEEAIETYRAGWSPENPHPTLVYNLGTALHHLDRLPEAILWYRRAPEPEDSWREDNLFLARRTLGSQSLPPGGVFGRLTQWEAPLYWAGIALAWMTLLLLIAVPRVPTWTLATLAVMATGCYATATASEIWGPHPVVVLTDCHTAVGDFPAGTEAWARRLPDGSWRISATAGAVCPADSVELVFPAPS